MLHNRVKNESSLKVKLKSITDVCTGDLRHFALERLPNKNIKSAELRLFSSSQSQDGDIWSRIKRAQHSMFVG